MNGVDLGFGVEGNNHCGNADDDKSPVSLSSLEIEFELCVSRKMIEASRARLFASLCWPTFRRSSARFICLAKGRVGRKWIKGRGWMRSPDSADWIIKTEDRVYGPEWNLNQTSNIFAFDDDVDNNKECFVLCPPNWFCLWGRMVGWSVWR